jgi:L-rhamnose mutarotase
MVVALHRYFDGHVPYYLSTGGKRDGALWICNADSAEEYRKRHRAVHPELIQTFSKLGIRDYSIFMQGSFLFGYWRIEGQLEEVLHALDIDPANCRWRAEMRPLMIPWEESVCCQKFSFTPKVNTMFVREENLISSRHMR